MTGPAASRARERAFVVASPTCLRARPAASVPRLRAPLRADPTSLVARPSNVSRSPSTSLVCWRPRWSMPWSSSCASSAVTRPRATASSRTSSMRSRVSITRLSGVISRCASASRSSPTFLPEKSRPRSCALAAGLVAALAPRPAVLRAACWRPRALPPALAARVRDALLRVPAPDALEARAALLREDELPPERAELLREDELPPERAAPLREEEPLRDDELREPDPPDDEREPDARDDPPLRDPPLEDPLLELRFDSAIS